MIKSYLKVAKKYLNKNHLKKKINENKDKNVKLIEKRDHNNVLSGIWIFI